MFNYKVYLSLIMGLALLTSCAQNENDTYDNQNHISFATVSDDQRELLNMLSAVNTEVLLFDFVKQATFTQLEVWVDVYQNGNLINQPSRIIISNENGMPSEGRVAAVASRDSGGQGFEWTLIFSEEEGVYIVDRGLSFIDDALLSRSFGAISSPVSIELTQDIILYTSLFTSGPMVSVGDQQRYLTEPELLSEIDFAYIIKARFS